MRRGIVHIGLPRTGTSSLQRVLHRRHQALAGAGILYPDLAAALAGAEAGNHKVLGEVLDGRRSVADKAAVLGALDRALAASEADIAILSYEGLVRIGAGHAPWRALAAALARHGFAMEVLLTVKAQSEYLNSLYTLHVRRLDEGRRFGAFVATALRRRPLDYAAMAAPWHRAATRLWAVPVADRRSSAPLVERILAEIGLAERVRPLLTAADFATAANRSPGPVAVEVARRLCLRRARAHLGTASAEQAARQGAALALARGFDTAPFNGVDLALAARLSSRFAPANDRFADLAWGCAWTDRTADRPAGPSNEIGGQATDAEVEAAIAAIVEEVARRFGLPPAAGRLRQGWRRAFALFRR
jgi:hypothetical protein